ncbi:MAG: calcineurin, partial [Spirochaetales bacterium]|nr:calcineurin [Spirochaetales bacterium]
VLTYFRVKYDLELLALYAEFERSLPLFAVGWNFLASHAAPASFYDYDHILNYHINEDVILGLTWTDNHQSMPGTIDVMLDYYIPDNGDGSYYFGGHRPIKGIYYRINGDRYVQFHNPWLQIVGFIDQSEPIDLDRDIIQIGETNDSEGRL